LREWSVADRAGYTGNYEFNYGVKDSAMAKAKGVFTLNWIKTEKGEWKITTADIHSIVSKQE
jgi:ketosteroid isomerase-like protein